MNKKEISEVKKQFSPDENVITRICGCYVNAEKEIKCMMKEAFHSIPEEEAFKYFDIFKHTLSGTLGKNLINMDFSLSEETIGKNHDFLLQLKNSKLEDDSLVEEFYKKIIQNYDYNMNYYIILIHVIYDVPGKASDGMLFWMGSQPFLKVNLNGQRFMNEYQPYDMVLHAASSQPYHTYCTVWDSKYPEDCKRFATHGCSRLYDHENGAYPVFPMEYVMGMNDELEAAGYIVKADTIGELAEKLNLPAEAFAATVERYNALAQKGEDDDFGKEGYRLSTLSEAPFYGVRQSGGYLICTMDGIQIDENMHALDTDYKAIPGLYVIGDMSGNYFSGSYPSLLAGAAAGRSATFGRLAGQNAAAGI